MLRITSDGLFDVSTVISVQSDIIPVVFQKTSSGRISVGSDSADLMFESAGRYAAIEREADIHLLALILESPAAIKTVSNSHGSRA